MIQIILAVIIATIVTLLMAYSARPNLDGFWEGTDAYYARSGTTVANVYIMDDKIYFYIKDSQGTILNKVANWMHCYNYAWFDDISPLPSTMSFKYDAHRGLLGFFEADTLILELVKNNAVTNNILCKSKN